MTALAEAREALGDPEKRLSVLLLEKVFEAAVEEQCENRESYDLEVNCAVLKVYAMHPLLLDTTMFKLILSKALMQLPKDHFTLALFTAPQTIYSKTTRLIQQTDPETREIIEVPAVEDAVFPVLEKMVQCEALLRSCRFEHFWELIKSCECLSFLYDVDGFVEAIQSYIISVVVESHRAIKRTALGKMVNMDAKSPEMRQLVLARDDWEADDQVFRRKPVKTSEASSK